MKYVCDICGYVYDPEVGDPDNGVAPAHLGRKSPKTGPAPLLGRKGSVQRGGITHNNRQERKHFLSCFLRFSATA